jgi:hypothetical protein
MQYNLILCILFCIQLQKNMAEDHKCGFDSNRETTTRNNTETRIRKFQEEYSSDIRYKGNNCS